MFLTNSAYSISNIDQFERELGSFLNAQKRAQTYPKYDMFVLEEGKEYRIDIASAGFEPEDFEATQDGNKLTVKANRPEREEPKCIERGLSYATWSRDFILADYVELFKLDYVNGVLRIYLIKNVPEEKKPKVFKINSDTKKVQLNG